MNFIRLPKLVKLHKYISQVCLEETQRLCWLATDPSSPLYAEIQAVISEAHPGEQEIRIEAITELGEVVEKAASRGGTTKGPHVAIPGYVPLENFISRVLLEELWRLTWLASDPESRLYDALQEQIPGSEQYRAEARKALKILGVVAQKAWNKCI